jgi:hypothetical protein
MDRELRLTGLLGPPIFDEPSPWIRIYVGIYLGGMREDARVDAREL